MFDLKLYAVIFTITLSLTFAQLPRDGMNENGGEHEGNRDQHTSCSYTITVPKSSEGDSCSSFLEVSWDLHDLRGQNEQLRGQISHLQEQYSELAFELQEIKQKLQDQGNGENGECQTVHLSKDSTVSLSNGDFERSGSWTFYGERGFLFTSDEAYSGSRSIIVAIDNISQDGGARQTLEFNSDHPTHMVVKGWSKAVNVVGNKDSHYSIYCDVIKPDGTPSWAHNVPFDVGTHDWQEVTVDIHIPEGIKRVSCYALFRYKTGIVYFDNISAKINSCHVHCKCG